MPDLELSSLYISFSLPPRSYGSKSRTKIQISWNIFFQLSVLSLLVQRVSITNDVAKNFDNWNIPFSDHIQGVL